MRRGDVWVWLAWWTLRMVVTGWLVLGVLLVMVDPTYPGAPYHR